MGQVTRTLALLWLVGILASAGSGRASSPAAPGSPPGRLEVLLEAATDPGRDTSVRLRAARDAVTRARQLGDVRSQAEAHHALGSVLLEREKLGEALEQFHAARRLFEAVDDPWGLSRAWRRIGDVNYRLGSYELAMEAYLAARDQLQRLDAPSREQRLAAGHLHVMVGNVFQRMGVQDQALAEFREAASIYGREEYDLGRAGVTLNIGNLLFDQRRYADALREYGSAREIAEKLGDDALLSMALTNLASTWTELGRYEEAADAIQRSEAICRKIGRTRGTLHNLVERGDLEQARGNPEAALQAYREALSLAGEISDSHTMAELHGNLATVLETLGRHREANAHLRAREELQKELLDATKLSNISRLRVAYEANAREREIELLRAKESSQRMANRFLRVALLLAVVLVLGLALLVRVRTRAAQEVARKNRELEEAYRQVERLSRTDDLTGLANRRDAVERLEREIRESTRSNRPFVLALADVDDFKLINDRHGHETGDRVLMALAQQIGSVIRAQDYAARLGGDEILLLFPDTPASVGHALADRIRESVTGIGPTLGTSSVSLTTSIGIVEGIGGDVESWLRLADRALYAAKARGKNQTVILHARRPQEEPGAAIPSPLSPAS